MINYNSFRFKEGCRWIQINPLIIIDEKEFELDSIIIVKDLW